MSPRPALQPGEHGAISVRDVTGWSVTPPPKPWAATSRFATADGRVVSLRAFGDSEGDAVTAMEARIAERRRESAPSRFPTLGEAVDAVNSLFFDELDVYVSNMPPNDQVGS